MTTRCIQPRTIVIPRQLEGFFHERLTRHFIDRPDVRVVIDRRAGERRRGEGWAHGPSALSERRRGDRRSDGVAWTLSDMPVSGRKRAVSAVSARD
jgi:hypothetical protein